MYAFAHGVRGEEERSNGERETKNEWRFDANDISAMPPFDVQRNLSRSKKAIMRNINEVICTFFPHTEHCQC